MTLTDSLDQILEWHRRNKTFVAGRIQPGLSEDEILTRLQVVPFQMTREFVELYRWRNGIPADPSGADTSLLEYHRFLPLQEALNNFQLSYPIMQEFYELSDWVQVFQDPAGDGYGISGGPEVVEAAPVVFLFEGEGVQVVFDNLTRMIETMAACFQEGFMTWEEGQLETDFFGLGEVAHRLNPEIQYWRDYVKGT